MEEKLQLKNITPSDFPRSGSWRRIKVSMPREQFEDQCTCISLNRLGISLLRLAGGAIVPNSGNHRLAALHMYFGGEQWVCADIENCDFDIEVRKELANEGIQTFADYVEFAEDGYEYEEYS